MSHALLILQSNRQLYRKVRCCTFLSWFFSIRHLKRCNLTTLPNRRKVSSPHDMFALSIPRIHRPQDPNSRPIEFLSDTKIVNFYLTKYSQCSLSTFCKAIDSSHDLHHPYQFQQQYHCRRSLYKSRLQILKNAKGFCLFNGEILDKTARIKY